LTSYPDSIRQQTRVLPVLSPAAEALEATTKIRDVLNEQSRSLMIMASDLKAAGDIFDQIYESMGELHTRIVDTMWAEYQDDQEWENKNLS
jgi:hypothetical protein